MSVLGMFATSCLQNRDFGHASTSCIERHICVACCILESNRVLIGKLWPGEGEKSYNQDMCIMFVIIFCDFSVKSIVFASQERVKKLPLAAAPLSG